MASLPGSTGCHPNNISEAAALAVLVTAYQHCFLLPLRGASQTLPQAPPTLRPFLLSTQSWRCSRQVPARPCPWPYCLGSAFYLDRRVLPPAPSPQVSAGLNRDLSKALICSEYLMQRWQTDFMLFINSDWLEVAAWSVDQLAKTVGHVRVLWMWVCVSVHTYVGVYVHVGLWDSSQMLRSLT